MKITIDNFKGMAPGIDAKLLPKNFAQTATNCDLRDGTISAYADLNTDATFSNPGALRSFYKYSSSVYLYWTESDINVVRLQLADSNDRLMYTGDGYPKQTDTTLMAATGKPDGTDDYRKVGIAAPSAALTQGLQGSSDGVVKYTVSYVYTYVVLWADGTTEESPPSPATNALDVDGGEYVRLKNFVIPTLGDTGNNITHVRVYRLAAGETGAEYKHIKSRTTGATETTDFYYDIPIADLPNVNEYVYDTDGTATDLWDASEDSSIETTDWANPPTDLAGLIQCQNGVLAAFSGRDIMFCEPFVFYAWPTAYKVPIDYDPVALGYYNEMVIVGTEAFPYVIWGTDPDTFISRVLPYPQKCLSARGMLSTDIGVFYPAPDGLMWINEDGGRIATKDSITKTQWEDLPPSGKDWGDSIAAWYDDKIYFFFSGSDKGLIFNIKEEVWYKDFDLTPNVYHVVVDPADDDLILLTNAGGNDYLASEWERHSSNTLTYEWKSKIFNSKRPVNLSVGRVKGAQAIGSAITLKVYGDGTQLTALAGGNWSKSVTNELPFRLPSGKLYEDTEISVSGAVNIESIELATSPDEL